MDFEFKVEDMISCFLMADREDLVEILNLIIEELIKVYEESTDEELDDEDLQVQVDEDGFMSLK